MVNLLITIIAIALVAVAAVMGAYYGGTAFLQGQAKAQANQIINNLRQVAGALTIWSINQGGTIPRPSIDIPVNGAAASFFTSAETLSFLAPNYLNTQETLFSFVYYNENAGTFNMKNPVVAGNVTAFPMLTDEVCRQIESLRTGTVSVTSRLSSSKAGNSNNLFCGQFGCFLADDGTFSNSYIAYHRVYGVPDTTKSDCN